MMRLIVVFLLVVCAPHYGQSTSKPVSTRLSSYWPRTSLLVEASEFMYDYDETVFWKFVDAAKDIDLTTLTEKDLYDSVLDRSEGLLPPTVYSLFILSLSLHTHSPAVEMYNQIALERISALGGVNCSAFLEFKGQLYCSVEDILSGLDLSDSDGDLPLYEFDHAYLKPNGNLPTVILYAEIGTEIFASMHITMTTLAWEGRVNYILRHYEAERPTVRTVLSGYGVELAVKSTEYKAVDDSKVKDDDSRTVDQSDGDSEEVEGFIFSTLKSHHPDLKGDLDEFRTHIMQGARELPVLRLWQLQDLGFQAAQRVMSSSPQLALKVIKDTAQNIPMQAKSLYRIQVSKDLRKEITANHRVLNSMGVNPGDSVLLMNGIVVQSDHTDIFQLLEMLLSEAKLLEGFSSLAIDSSHYHTLLTLPVHTADTKSFAVDVRNESVVFLNDLETERFYKSWPKSLREFLQPAYPGTLRQVAKNVFNIVFMVDPVTSEGIEMFEYIKLFLNHHVPVRLGLVLLPSDEVGVAIAQGFTFLVEHKSAREALKWILKVQSSSLEDGSLTVEGVRNSFDNKYNPQTLANLQLEDVFGDKFNGLWKKSVEFFSSKGFVSSPQVLVNGVQLDLTEDLETAIVSNIQQQMMPIQQAIFKKKLTDRMNVYDYLLNKSNVLQRVNKHLIAGGKQYDLSATTPEASSNKHTLSDGELSAIAVNNLHYFSRREGEFLTKEVSLWVVGDFSQEQTRQSALEALQFVSTSDHVRVGLVPIAPSPHATLIEACLLSQSEEKAWSFIHQLLALPLEGVDNQEAWQVAEEGGVNTAALKDALEAADAVIADYITFASRVLSLSPGATAILSNGRLIGPLADNETFLLADYDMLFKMESSQYSGILSELVNELGVDGLGADDDTSSFRSDLVMRLASLLLSQPKRRRLGDLPPFKQEHSVLHLPASEASVEMKMVAILNPLSTEAQKLAPLLQVLQVALSLDITIILNPLPKLTEMPVNSFYRYVLEPELSFTMDGLSVPPVAVFNDLPQTPLLTLHLDVPHSWLVEAVWSPHDLDNIHLDEASDAGVHAELELKNILVEGQCFDAGTDHPIPGLEYVLGTDSQPELFDTIVMANLGYFQLKAGPGAWILELREGRSRQIYSIQSHIGGDKRTGSTVSITVKSFRGAGVIVYVAKQPGMESVQLLVDDRVEEKPATQDEGNIWSSLSSLMGGAKEKAGSAVSTSVPRNETINIFSVASGHLYERFLRIMMLSVLKNTENPVKFWFLKNFLSPTFKDFIPIMASKYGFDYELVEYKWPRWLHAQTQKQRIIWGYKILFLDVLFPLSVKKIIFVDADQIVRTDMRELLEVPMGGAPYAYTPFCDSRPDMAGFRFWDSGYWKNHLGNRRYHISALYMIDLLRFRQLAAGDRLRGQYQALSQDPNSLANLDQDLPNNMIHAVPIKSLPQDWLWCETWCSLESKETAKTIDLCNNPLTKEPKLQAAVRIVPEWTSYDTEIKQLMEGISEAKTTTRPHLNKQGHTHSEL